MKIEINGKDYTASLDAVTPLMIERRLNKPTVCRMKVCLPEDGSVDLPQRNQAVAVVGDDGTIYFTGYLAVAPMAEFAGQSLRGEKFRYALQAISDELLLDQLGMASSSSAAGSSAAAILKQLVVHAGASSLSTSGVQSASVVSSFSSHAGSVWSQSAAALANSTRSSYRVLSGDVALTSIPVVVHDLDQTAGTLALDKLQFVQSEMRALANDVTVCGKHEAVAYVTEYFEGDGATKEFALSAAPYLTASTSKVVIDELFNESSLNTKQWSGTGGCWSIGDQGLAIAGGSGEDGTSVLEWLDSIELGGTLLLEATGVTLSAGSSGTVLAFSAGSHMQSACVAGFAVSNSGSNVVLQPLVEGALSGTAYTLSSAQQYALRIRVHCPEQERQRAVYLSWGDAGALSAGGDKIAAGGWIQMEVQPYVNGIGATPVTLFDGAVSTLAPSCNVLAASSLNMNGTMRSLTLRDFGSVWVQTSIAGASASTNRLGVSSENSECHVEAPGKVVFYSGYAPASGAQVAVSYRTTGRAVGRAVNAASQSELAAAGLPTEVAWTGSVTSPEARSSADCRNAASVMVQAAASASALWRGSYAATQFAFESDVWPGDALELKIAALDLDAQMVVRTVRLSYAASSPDVVHYLMDFANDWAEDLAIKTSTTVPEDAWLPATASPTLLSNLTSLSVTALSGSTVAVDAGIDPPTGGGFEIRRRDFSFMAGEDAGLVMRSTTRAFSFAREMANDRFYIRMYDGSTPPNYSEFSTALFINLPLGS